MKKLLAFLLCLLPLTASAQINTDLLGEGYADGNNVVMIGKQNVETQGKTLTITNNAASGNPTVLTLATPNVSVPVIAWKGSDRSGLVSLNGTAMQLTGPFESVVNPSLGQFIVMNASAVTEGELGVDASLDLVLTQVTSSLDIVMSGMKAVGIGGATASFPGLVNSGTTLEVRLADNSADAPLTTGALSASGHVTSTGSAPAVTLCGTGSPTVSGTDTKGVITTGTAAASCTLTFASAYTTAPTCVLSDNSSTVSASVTSITTGVLTIGLGAGLTGGNIYYICLQ